MTLLYFLGVLCCQITRQLSSYRRSNKESQSKGSLSQQKKGERNQKPVKEFVSKNSSDHGN